MTESFFRYILMAEPTPMAAEPLPTKLKLVMFVIAVSPSIANVDTIDKSVVSADSMPLPFTCSSPLTILRSKIDCILARPPLFMIIGVEVFEVVTVVPLLVTNIVL